MNDQIRAFIELVEAQVSQFNEIVPNSESFFDVSEESTSLDQKIIELKEIFDSLKDITQLDIDNAALDDSEIDQAIERTQHILDILNDDDSPHAPWMVQRGILDEFLGAADNSIWQPLAKHRQKISGELRLSLSDLLERESVLVTAQRQTGQLPPHLIRSGWK